MSYDKHEIFSLQEPVCVVVNLHEALLERHNSDCSADGRVAGSNPAPPERPVGLFISNVCYSRATNLYIFSCYNSLH